MMSPTRARTVSAVVKTTRTPMANATRQKMLTKRPANPINAPAIKSRRVS